MPTFLFAGGGTGGHLFPALAIAERLAHHNSESHSRFLCSTRSIDEQILSREGIPFDPIPARPFGLRPATLVRFVWNWGGSLRAARAVIARERAAAPDSRLHMVAMGGFVAAPCAQAARAERIPLTLINLDAIPGKANRWIARRADMTLTSAQGRCPEAWERIPPIVRAGAVVPDAPPDCRVRLNLDPQAPTLLITGGSQGAESINNLILALLRDSPERFRGWQVIHQSGSGAKSAGSGREQIARDELCAAYRAAGVPALVQPFFTEMGLSWRASDLALTRCGAGAVAEAWANRVPALFLPYPYHRDEHQRWNAQPLVAVGGALLERDLIDPLRNASAAGVTLAALLGDPPRLRSMAQALERLGPADGADRAARRILGI